METVMPEPIDIHQHQRKLEHELRVLAEDQRIHPANRENLARFVHDARIGRTIEKGARRRLSLARCRKLLVTLKTFALYVQKPLTDVTVADMERFILGIEDGVVDKRSRIRGSKKYSPATVLDFKKILRKWSRWQYPHDESRVKDLTGWFDTRDWAPELKTFGIEDAKRMAQAVQNPQGRALVLALFDGGFRAGELLNVRLSDIEFRADGANEPICYVRIRVSKTKPRTISLPIAGEAVRFWVERHPAGGPVGPDGRIQARDLNAPLLTWTYHYCRKVIAAVGRAELGQNVYFHRYRHASATWWARRLNTYQLTARFGWSMGSRAVQRYVDHSGVLAEDVARLVRAEEKSGSTRMPGVGQVSGTAYQTAGAAAATPSDELARLLASHPELLETLKSIAGSRRSL
jgi:integrase